MNIQIKKIKSLPDIVGIVSDSHGQTSVLEKAIYYLKQKGCKIIIHLGDICDSSIIKTADDCISLVQKNEIIAIRGNNDHSMSISKAPGISQPTIDFIKNLPLAIQTQQFIFTHSLPFVKELGLSCMIQNMNENHMQMFFNDNSISKLLFKGHSHNPELVIKNDRGFLRKKLDFPNQIFLKDKCIINCGAVMDNHCAIFYPNQLLFEGMVIK